MSAFVQIQMGRRLETLLADVTYEVTRFDMNRIVIPQFTLLGETLATFVAHEREVFRVHILYVGPQPRLGGILFVAFRTFELPDAGM